MTKSPLKAIRLYCLQCGESSYKEVRLCPADECPLHAFRQGKNPYRKHNLSESYTDYNRSCKYKPFDIYEVIITR